MTWLLGVFAVYLGALLVIGALASRVAGSVEGFFLADRRQGSWVTAVSAAASSESGWVTLGLVGMGYAQGLSAAWFVVGCLLGFFVNWVLVAPRLRRLSRDTDALTLPDLLEARTRDAGLVRIVAVLVICMWVLGYVGAQFTAAGKTFQVVFDLDYRLGVLIGAVITVAYTIMGGYRAVSWTDLLQGLLMTFGLVVLPVYLVFFHGELGGLADLERRAAATPARRVLKLEVCAGGALPQKETVYLEGGELWLGAGRREGLEDRIAVAAGERGALALAGLPEGHIGLQVPQGRTLLPGPPPKEGGEAVPPILRVVNRSGLPLGVRLGGGEAKVEEVAPGREADIELVGAPALAWGGATVVGEFKEVARGSALVDPTFEKGGLALLGLILGALGIGLGYPGQPHVLTRFMAASSRRVVVRGRLIAMTWGVLSLYGAVWLGHAARVVLPALADPEFAYPAAAKHFLPGALAGLLIAAIIAAIMSTADSQLLVAASAVARDVYQKLLRRGADVPQRAIVRLSRLVVLGLGLLGLGLAFVESRVVFWFVLLSWSGLGASFGPPLVLALTWPRLTSWGVVAGMVTGTAVTFGWYFRWGPAVEQSCGLGLYELVPAFAASLVATVLVSLVTRAPEGAAAMVEAARERVPAELGSGTEGA